MLTATTGQPEPPLAQHRAGPAHPYLTLADGSQVDAVRNLDLGSPYPYELGKNPGRAFIDAPGDGGFATAPDLVRFAHALADGTVLDRPWADVLTGAKIPHGPTSFGAYTIPIHIVGGQWVFGRAGANPGCGASWNIYPYTGWVGVTLTNYDNFRWRRWSIGKCRPSPGVHSAGRVGAADPKRRLARRDG
jgi:Beta-lactamase